MAEIQRLKLQLDMVVKSEATKAEQLEMAKASLDILLSDRLKLMESFSSLASELEESRTQVNTLEEVVKKSQEYQLSYNNAYLPDHDSDFSERLKEIGSDFLESEVEQLKSALEDLEMNYLAEEIKSMVYIQSAHQFVERVRIESALRGAESELMLKNIKAEIVELKASLYDKERELWNISVLNKKLRLINIGRIDSMAGLKHICRGGHLNPNTLINFYK